MASDETERYSEFRRVAEAAAREGGAILLDWAGRFTVQEKSRANLVTEADFAAQRAIVARLHQAFPEHNFLAEEEQVFATTTSPCRWVIDPLDGTSNYVHGFPYYAVSIGLEEAGRLVVGVIYDPTRDEMFGATRGGGADLNGCRLATSDVTTLGGAFLMASLPVASDPSHPAVKRFLGVLPQAQTVQRSGSAALNLANVAAGRVDGFWSFSLKPWDMAAGVLIVEEAGGTVTKPDGRPFVLEEPQILTSAKPSLHAELIAALADAAP